MKKNILAISIVAMLLSGVLVLVNHANAATSNVTLAVTASTFSCSTYPTSVNMGSVVASTTSTNMTTDTWSGSFTCVDLKTTRSTQMTAQSTALTGGTAGVIAATNITWTPAGSITQVNGDCGGLSLGTGGTLNAAKTIIKKTGVKTCSFTYAPDGMSVNVPAYSPVNSYTAVMTITDPT